MPDPSPNTFGSLQEVPEPVWLFLAKMLGAVSGSAVSIAYMLPKGKREAALRFAIGITAGLIFGSAVGLKLADELEVVDRLSMFEITLSGATLASLCAWWGIGALARITRKVAQ